MLESEWVRVSRATGEDTGEMENFLQDKGSPRTLRLFACACCRRLEVSLTDPRSRRAVEMAEQYADGEVGKELVEIAWRQADQATTEIDDTTSEAGDFRPYHAALAAHWTIIPWWDTSEVVSLASHAAFYALRAAEPAQEAVAQGRILADILGRPASLVSPDTDWLTENVVALANGIYAKRAFDRMPILADALEEAGCNSTDILDHCRSNGPHAPGCWVIDLLLNKN